MQWWLPVSKGQDLGKTVSGFSSSLAPSVSTVFSLSFKNKDPGR